MVGCPPGGSAGTSFCSGTEISISRLAMGVSLSVSVFIFCRFRASGVLPLDPVFQNANLLDVKLDRITVFEIPAEFKPAAIADGAGSDELAGHQRLVLGDMGDDLLERKQHAVRDALRAHLAVDARLPLELVGIAYLVRRHDPGAHDVAAIKALAFGRTKAALHLNALGIPRRKIVEDGVAEDVIFGL